MLLPIVDAGLPTGLVEPFGARLERANGPLVRHQLTDLQINLGAGNDSATVGEDKSATSVPSRTVNGILGEVTIETPRDRESTFDPQIVGKHQRRVPGFDEKILALYAKGMTTRDIQEIVQELYGVEVSPTLISSITEDLDAEVTAWRSRPLAT